MGLFILALVVRLAGLGWGLPNPAEEAYPLKVAWIMSGLSGTGGFTLDPHFFRYPTLVIYLNLAVLGLVRVCLAIIGQATNAAAARALYLSDPSVFFLAARSLTAVLGALIVLPVYRMARVAGGHTVGVVAAALVALNPFLISKSQMVDVDVPMTLLVTLCLAQSVAIAYGPQPPRTRATLLAGATAGLAASAKYPGALVMLPLIMAIAWRTKSIRATVLHASFAMVAALCAFALTSPFVFLDGSQASRDMGAESAHLRLGHFGSEGGAAWSFYLAAWFKTLLGWLPGAFAAIGIVVFALWRRLHWAVICAVLVATFWLAIVGWALKADRYLLPVVPAASVFAAALACLALQRLPRKSWAMAGAGLLALVWVATDAPRWHDAFARQGVNPSEEAKRWIEENLPEESMVVVEAYGPQLYSPLTALRAEDTRDGKTPRRYWLVPVPMFQVEPERAAVYYDPALYNEADAWVVVGAVAGRYRREPGRFPNQNAFYAWLERTWTEAARFEANGAGSEIVIYRNPNRTTPFGSRVAPPPAPTDMMRASGGAGGEATFYFNLGGNYLEYGHPKEAAACFETALSFPTISGGVTRERLEGALAMTRSP
ncbi:MAG TPA: glycosyltransferase family 39 protein [Candidatus Eisenbacteria bacterium]|nr:glycosyltransferase family 39 protein [Candidatus Eisenbacteria bacterium]